ncbi:YraN family protein [Paramicrobacterium fandaimingii]|uniref:YraN family protein n=1 Tax=Paramicrobacterium fandaimingii TaxID=2708079 RepID=UPI00141FECED|nr:YraN family protein [Microbacterium fandaimingii]
MRESTIEFGARGEGAACAYLEQAGYEILERNWRNAAGEIDVIARVGDTVVFIEVKTRSSIGYGHPFEAITRDKSRRLRRLAGQWVADTHSVPRRIRIDAIAVLWPSDGHPSIEHLEQVC